MHVIVPTALGLVALSQDPFAFIFTRRRRLGRPDVMGCVMLTLLLGASEGRTK